MSKVKKRVVVTGIGAVTPIGITLEKIGKSLRESLSGVRLITHFSTEKLPVKFAGEATDFKAEDFLDVKEIRRNDRFIQMCLAAADMAVEDSSIDKALLEKAGVAIGVGLGGLYSIEEAVLDLSKTDNKRVNPFFIPSILANLASGQVSIRYRTKGPNYAVSSACASGSQAIGQAYREIQAGRHEIWIAGGSEAPITPLSITGFASARALSRRNEEPVLASRPFDQERDGFVLGEGSAIFILETLDSALKRGAKIYAEIVGFGIASDGYHVTEPDPNGEGAFLAMQEALLDSGLDVEQIDYVNAHATSTPLGDKVEGIAMERIFGQHLTQTFVSSTKSLTGHSCGAAGSMEMAFCLLMLAKDFLPPAFNLDRISPEFTFKSPGEAQLDYRAEVIMNNSFGFGGVNTSLLLKRVESE